MNHGISRLPLFLSFSFAMICMDLSVGRNGKSCLVVQGARQTGNTLIFLKKRKDISYGYKFVGGNVGIKEKMQEIFL